MQLHWTLLFDILRRSDGNKRFLRYGRNQIWSPLVINIIFLADVRYTSVNYRVMRIFFNDIGEVFFNNKYTKF